MPDETIAQDGSVGQPEAPQAPADSANLQFDRAEFKNALACSACKANIVSDFYRVEGQPICSSCHAQINEKLFGGSKARRFIRAAIFGSIGALVGAGIYYAVLAITGLEIGLISILVGVIVGAAVRHGSDQRGGWVYQCMAIFLTYTSIVSAYVPLLVSEFRKIQGRKPAAAQTASAAPKGAAAQPGVKPASAKPAPAKLPDPDEADDEEELSNQPQRPPPSGFGLLVALFMLIGLIYAIPFLAGAQNILGLLIIGFGLYQAWKMNVRTAPNIRGPFPMKNSAQEVRPGSA